MVKAIPAMLEPRSPSLVDESLSDAEIVALVRGGERQLYEQLMRRHNQSVFRTLRALLRSDSEAEDVAQEAWVRAYFALDQFAGRASFSTWVVRIALNEGLARLKSASRFQELPMATLSTREPSPEQQAGRAELRRLLAETIDELPDTLRLVFVLREVEGRSTSEAAEILGLSEENVKVRLHRARAGLRRAIERRLGDEVHQLHAFAGERCDRVVAAVLARIASGA